MHNLTNYATVSGVQIKHAKAKQNFIISCNGNHKMNPACHTWLNCFCEKPVKNKVLKRVKQLLRNIGMVFIIYIRVCPERVTLRHCSPRLFFNQKWSDFSEISDVLRCWLLPGIGFLENVLMCRTFGNDVYFPHVFFRPFCKEKSLAGTSFFFFFF